MEGHESPGSLLVAVFPCVPPPFCPKLWQARSSQTLALLFFSSLRLHHQLMTNTTGLGASLYIIFIISREKKHMQQVGQPRLTMLASFSLSGATQPPHHTPQENVLLILGAAAAANAQCAGYASWYLRSPNLSMTTDQLWEC